MIGGLMLMLGFVMFVVWVAKRYQTCPSNRVLVISGKISGTGPAKCVHGGAKFVWPVIQQFSYLSLEPIQIEIPLRGALSMMVMRLVLVFLLIYVVKTLGRRVARNIAG